MTSYIRVGESGACGKENEAGVAVAVFFVVVLDWETEQKIVTAIVMFFMTFVSCYILLMISALIYKKRLEKLESEGDEEDAGND